MSLGRLWEMVDREHPKLPIVRQCALLEVRRSSLYYRPKAASEEDLSLMGEIDRQYLETPFYGSRRMRAWLGRHGMQVSRKRVQRLMRAMGLRAIYRRPSTSRRSPERRVYPYLLRNVRITQPNQVSHPLAVGDESLRLRQRRQVDRLTRAGKQHQTRHVRTDRSKAADYVDTTLHSTASSSQPFS